MSEPVPVLELAGVVRTFIQAGAALEVLRGVDFALRPGEVTALVGPSGAGKSTLLHIAGLLERPTAGTVFVDGADVSEADDGERTALRRSRLGFVYQFHHLLPEFSALENVVLPQMIAGVSKRAARVRARELLSAAGLINRETHRPARLSGGEQQRVAIARALANKPRLIIADEPTGNLDPHTAGGVFKMLTEVARREGSAALIATHNLDLARRMDRVLEISEGRTREATLV